MRKKKQLIILVLLISSIFALVFHNNVTNFSKSSLGVLGETSFWIQTDWSGGANPSTITNDVNTYNSQNDIDDSDVGEIKLNSQPLWSVDYLNWSNRRTITFDNTTVNLDVISTDLVDFPVLVKLEDGVNIDYSKTRDNGEDIRFTDSEGTVLSYEIELWDESGVSIVWVRVPMITADSDSDFIYMYYDNDEAEDAQEPQNVWDDDYKAVWHNTDLTSTLIEDSTTLNNIGKRSANEPLEVDSPIGKAQRYDGQNDYSKTLNNVDGPSSRLSIEGWFKHNGNGSNYEAVLHKGTNSTIGSSSFWMGLADNDDITATIGAGNGVGWAAGRTSTNAVLNQWYYVAATWDGSVVRVFVDGLQVSQYNLSNYTNLNTPTRMGASSDGSNYQFNGDIDDVRISGTDRSPSWIAATYKHSTDNFNSYGSEEYNLPDSGTLTSNIFDAIFPSDWGLVSYTGIGLVNIKVRSDVNEDMSTAEDWTNCEVVNSDEDLSDTNCVDDSDRYIQYQVELLPDGPNNSTLEDITIAFEASDQNPPETNATLVTISGLGSDGDWFADEPVISWTAGVDDSEGNGLLGYCIALDESEPDTSSGLDPLITSGALSSLDDGIEASYCPYIVLGTNIDLSEINSLELISGKQYYFSIKAVDLSGNVYTGANNTWQDMISWKYDAEPPSPPFYLSLPVNFLSSKDVIITWPVGVGGAADSHSGLAGLQYKIGQNGIWYGDFHTGTEDMNDLLANDGSYVTDETYDYPVLEQGNNVIFFRAVDNLGNVTDEEDYVKGIIKLNTVAPSSVRNLTVDPQDSTTNSYSFSWDVPSTFTGSQSGLTYCYSVNSLPSATNCTYTAAGQTSLIADSFATQPGSNTLYVVAKDEAGNINYATYNEAGASVEFTYSGSAPGIPVNIDAADISVKDTKNWRLVISWDKPTNVGAGISYYDVYRSTQATTCSSNFGAFAKVGSSTSTSYIDAELNQENYAYCVKACDSANNCSAISGSVVRLPTGKFTEPAKLISAPEVSRITTRRAVIEWVTDRASDSSVQFGVASEDYFEAEIATSEQTALHSIPLDNLEPGTTYYFKAKWTDVDGNTGYSEEKTFSTLPAPTVSDSVVSNINTSSAVIDFTVENAVEATILYGLSENYGGSETLGTSQERSRYSIQLTGLTEGSTYNFKFNLTDIDGNEYDYFENRVFETLPFPNIQDISVEEIRNTSKPTVNLSWVTNVDATSQIEYYPESNPSETRNIFDNEAKTEHSAEISGLKADTAYLLFISVRDRVGNQVSSDEVRFTTATDSRPPEISNVKLETRLTEGSTDIGEDAYAQIVVTWDTDELATSQVQYVQGTGNDFTQKTPLDENLTFNHIVVINNLSPSNVYKLQVLSQDSAGNEGQGRSLVTISAQVQENPLEVILSRLGEVFAFIR